MNRSNNRSNNRSMSRLVKILIPAILVTAASGCVVVPAHRGYWGGPGVAVVAPAPVVVVHPWYR
jgi:hypothetical protein